MPLRTKVGLAWFIAANAVLAWLLSPYHEIVAVVLIIATAIPATLFALVYGFTVPWWETLIGKAMLISSTALALLVDITLLYRVFGDDYYLREVVLMFVLQLISQGAWWKWGALIREKWRAWRDRRVERLS